MKNLLIIFVTFASLAISVQAQPYSIAQSVIANGGLQSATGAGYEIAGTAGQSAAGQNMINSPYVYTQVGGFWINFLPPTAASVTVRGRVVTPEGRGLMNARVIMTDVKGNSRIAITRHFGYYEFDDVQVGELYIFKVLSKRYEFRPQAVVVMEQIENLDFVALPRN